MSKHTSHITLVWRWSQTSLAFSKTQEPANKKENGSSPPSHVPYRWGGKEAREKCKQRQSIHSSDILYCIDTHPQYLPCFASQKCCMTVKKTLKLSYFLLLVITFYAFHWLLLAILTKLSVKSVWRFFFFVFCLSLNNLPNKPGIEYLPLGFIHVKAFFPLPRLQRESCGAEQTEVRRAGAALNKLLCFIVVIPFGLVWNLQDYFAQWKQNLHYNFVFFILFTAMHYNL